METKKKNFKIVKLTPYVISVWGDKGYLSISTLLRNLCNKGFVKGFLKRNKEIISTHPNMSDEEIIDNLVFLYSLDIETIKEEFDTIKLFLSENLIRFSDQEFQRKYSSSFFRRYKNLPDIWLEV